MAKTLRVAPFGNRVPAGRAVYGRAWSAEVTLAVTHPDRTGYRVVNDLAGDYVFQEWPNRAALLKTIEMQASGPSRPDHWHAFVK
jgi:hypothetical protein